MPRRNYIPKSHQRSWWIVQALPIRAAGRLLLAITFPIPPTQLVDLSRSTYTSNRPTPVSRNSNLPNPTNAVGGSFRLNLHEQPADSRFSKLQSPQSHQRSWWIFQAQPTRATGRTPRRNYTPQSHQRSWWIVQAQPTRATGRLLLAITSPIPPTQLVDRSRSALTVSRYLTLLVDSQASILEDSASPAVRSNRVGVSTPLRHPP